MFPVLLIHFRHKSRICADFVSLYNTSEMKRITMALFPLNQRMSNSHQDKENNLIPQYLRYK